MPSFVLDAKQGYSHEQDRLRSLVSSSLHLLGSRAGRRGTEDRKTKEENEEKDHTEMSVFSDKLRLSEVRENERVAI